MFFPGTIGQNEKGKLEIGSCDVLKLVEEHGTPLNVLDEKQIRENCRSYSNAFKDNYDDYQVIYAGKAFLNRSICKIMDEEGLGLDVVSGGELYTAIKAQFPTEKIYFHGNNKSKDELELAIDNDVGRIVVDNFYELELLEELCRIKNKAADVYIRITPGIEAHTHDYIKTGMEDSKFGFNITDDGVWEVIDRINNIDVIQLKGLHCHIGSQIFDKEPFKLAAKTMMDLILKIKQNYGLELRELDLGGGIGIRYTGEEKVEVISEFVEMVTKTVKDFAKENDIKAPKLMLEPGRSIIGEAGIMLYTIGSIKEIKGIRKYVSVDGGMSDNIRPALYSAEYTALLANKLDWPKEEKVTIAGKACESGDILIENIELPKVESGDILAMLSCGAYTYSMANNYNLLPRPAVVMVKDGKSHVIIERETYEDLLSKDTFLREACK
ncbi:diaminopimelate decarboxylase [Natranaerofaba carboxydovora]|uniref:diaminopimelate decarboxylase n=1 Tax=Natranaerofaba carboxydovora TaxID=2742683 RepID=UPI001F13D1E4|nr:diaminopimelate decarboxylase [Natranaerofaba carboxydovora]UMZ73217.1 Diaminopimelate decarboxylase [Natranaerofaba carboxydovora]